MPATPIYYNKYIYRLGIRPCQKLFDRLRQSLILEQVDADLRQSARSTASGVLNFKAR